METKKQCYGQMFYSSVNKIRSNSMLPYCRNLILKMYVYHNIAIYVCDNIMLLFCFVFVYTEWLSRLNGRSVLFVCLTAFWQNGGKTIA